jgi:hypothetical protein
MILTIIASEEGSTQYCLFDMAYMYAHWLQHNVGMVNSRKKATFQFLTEVLFVCLGFLYFKVNTDQDTYLIIAAVSLHSGLNKMHKGMFYEWFSLEYKAILELLHILLLHFTFYSHILLFGDATFGSLVPDILFTKKCRYHWSVYMYLSFLILHSFSQILDGQLQLLNKALSITRKFLQTIQHDSLRKCTTCHSQLKKFKNATDIDHKICMYSVLEQACIANMCVHTIDIKSMVHTHTCIDAEIILSYIFCYICCFDTDWKPDQQNKKTIYYNNSNIVYLIRAFKFWFWLNYI